MFSCPAGVLRQPGNLPYRGHNPRYLDVSYGYSAAQAVEMNPRRFSFLRNPDDFAAQDAAVRAVLWPPTKAEFDKARQRIGTAPQCDDTLRILDHRLLRGADGATERIEWLKFEVELCSRKAGGRTRVLFKQRFHDGIRSGAITLTFRRWIRAQVRVGGTYRLDADGAMEATSVQEVRVSQISDAEARRAGYADRATMIAELGRRDQLTDADKVYRIEFRYVAQADPRLALREDDALSDAEVGAIIARLDRMDAAAPHGPWTRAVLRLIEAQPRVVSTKLAAKLGRERFEFKTDVRKLKALGLTISHEVGYELSARGRAVLRRLRGRD